MNTGAEKGESLYKPLSMLLAILLAIASKKLYAFEDPRIEQVEALLPHSNCGACGTAGCHNFAEKAVAGEIEPGRCTVNTPDQNKNIAALLGVALGDIEKRVARLACAGGTHVAKMRANYAGLSSCRAAVVAGGGGKSCAWGCLGLGDCADVCDFDAITMDVHGLPVVDVDKCTACGDCVDVGPKDLFSLQVMSHKTIAPSRGGVETILTHCWSMSHAAIPADTKQVLGIGPELLRLAVGIEDVEDLWDDLAQALAP